MITSEMFSAFIEKADSLLRSHGFNTVQQSLNEAFGSHCARYENNNTFLLLIWDGKEQWLTIRTEPAREELFFRKLNADKNAAEHQQAIDAALNTLQHYFSSTHDHDEDGHCCGHHHP